MEYLTTLTEDGQEVDILEAMVKLGPVIKQLLPYDFSLGVTDRECYLAYFPARNSKLGFGFNKGDLIPQRNPCFKAIQTGTVCSETLPKEYLGVHFSATGMPVKDGTGTVIGAIVIGLSTESFIGLQESSQQIAATSQEVSAATEELAAQASQLHVESLTLKESGDNVVKQVNKTYEVLQFINEISANSNLLGLNAAIEAARAGEHGKGFAVVAEEIRKMAMNSQNSVKNIKEILSGITQDTQIMMKRIDAVLALIEHQAAGTEEIGASMEELTHIAGRIDEAVKSL